MLWLPQSAAVEARREYESRVHMMIDHDVMAGWNARLHEIDPDLQLVKAKETAIAQGLKPGYWHVIRWNGGAAPFIHVHEGPNGEFREPDSGLLHDLGRKDMWSAESMRERGRRTRALSEAHEKAEAEERRRRNEEAVERFKALENPGVSLHRTGDRRA